MFFWLSCIAHLTVLFFFPFSFLICVAGSVEERKSPCHSTSYLINSPANIANAYTDQGVSLSTQKPDFGDITRNDNDHSVASYKILPLDFQHVKVKSIVDSADIDHTVPSAISAVPESGSVWKYVYFFIFIVPLVCDSWFICGS